LEEKTTLSRFLDLAGDYLKDGYYKEHKDPVTVQTETQAHKSDEANTNNLSSLPLAYQVEEDESSGSESSIFESPDSALAGLYSAINNCNECPLGSGRINPVPGEGAANPLVMVIGEGPDEDEDRTGRPFAGKAGQLLDRMLASVGLSRETNCYITNIVKCRPPENRDPGPEEISSCIKFLKRQIILLRPLVILCAGRVAAQNILDTREGINSLRNSFTEYRPGFSGDPGEEIEEKAIPVLCTFHPGAILRDESLKRPVWEDLKLLRSKLISLNGDYAASAGDA